MIPMLCNYLIHLLLWAAPCSVKPRSLLETSTTNDRVHWQRRKGEWLCAWLYGPSVLVQTVPSNERHDQNDKIPRKRRVMADTPHNAYCHTNELRNKSRGEAFGISWLLSVCIKSFVSLAMFKWNVDLSIFEQNFLLVPKAKSNHPWKVMKHAMFSQEAAHSL